jgi:hypothetical protein
MRISPIAPGKFQEHLENAGIFRGELYFPESIGDNGNGNNKPNVKRSPHNFKKLDFPDPHSCSACGRKKDSWYIENLTPIRKKQPSLDPWYLCQRFYQQAVKRHTRSVLAVPLPGTISLAALEPVRTEHGWCSICGLV